MATEYLQCQTCRACANYGTPIEHTPTCTNQSKVIAMTSRFREQREGEERRQGLRYNEGKPRVDLIPAIVLLELGKHYTYGANKYHPNNWLKGFPYSETTASLLRHLYAWMAGERNDAESGHHHLVAVIWNAVALFYFELFPDIYNGFDDRVLPHTKSMVEVAPLPEGFKVDADPLRVVCNDCGAFTDAEHHRLTCSVAPNNQGPMGIPVPDSFFAPTPPTIPIPESYAMVTDGMTLMDGDLWLARNVIYGDTWVEIGATDIGKKYDSTLFGSPVIRKYVTNKNTTTDPYRSTQIKIPASKPQRWVQDGPDDKRDFKREY